MSVTISPSVSQPTIGPSVSQERREQRLTLLLLAPALAVIVCLLIVPLGWLAWQSIRQDGGFTLANYQRFLTDDATWMSFLTTFRIAFTVTLAALLLGYPVAYVAAAVAPAWRMVILALVVLPFWTSVLVRSYAWLILLQRRGIINSALTDLGLIDSPLLLVNNELGTVIATIHILLPFMVLPLYAAMQKIPRELTMAGASLGGSPSFVFLRVFLPLSLPGVIAGAVLVFALTLGFYITPELLGGGRTYMVSMLVSRNIEVYNEWGAASSISVVLLACVFLIFRVASLFIPFERIMGAR
jgi:putative spermidine/putrescine transport system permease protein